ncbi:T9SS type A sorting domain-containing protein [Cytophagaceae bacterium DM2B3-1]|uniref:T9SS type A sorting domain-containing protein n=1 Tax=Xanthocytophaga flava TaxID=3048013 RepID=A0ABT7CXU8_9BACT|nr:T9SS type A sorting domain-containing protein [Xanthocytophaga flavus]MDJ1498567.1 T9SS type A sorting domain-containing protein [Xanthocytophaga flavus]
MKSFLVLYFTLVIICFGHSMVLAQSPAGISSNLNLWLKANTGVTGTTTVTNWTDNSTQTNNATGSAPAPSYITTGSTLFNYNSYLQFTAASSQMLSLTAAKNPLGSGTQARTFYTVTFPSSAADENTVIGQGTNATGTTNQGRHLRYITNTNRLIVDTDGRVRGSASATNSRPFIATFSVAASETQALSASSFGAINGVTTSITSYSNGSANSSINTASTLAQIGHRPAETNYFDGRIAEIISYPGIQHSATQRQQVESYLAVKYGITMTNNYLNSAGSTIFTVASPYNNNIIGIARDDNSGLIQRQSHNYDDSARVYLSTLTANNTSNTGTFLTNNQYILMGANTSRLRATSASMSEMPLGLFSRISREWKVTNTGFTGTFNWDVTLESGIGGLNASDLRLLVDTDGNFSDATTYSSLSGLTFSVSGNKVSVSGISIIMIPTGTTRFITLASSASTTPLPVAWLNFKGYAQNEGVILQWNVASETNNAKFTVERSLDGIHYEAIATITGKGTTSQQSPYSYTDTNPLVATAYYRIQQTDVTGESSYSSVISISYTSTRPATQFTVFPNPARSTDSISLSFEGTIPAYTDYTIYDFSGHILSSDKLETSDTGIFTMNTQLIKGMYLVRLTGEGVESKFQKLIIE